MVCCTNMMLLFWSKLLKSPVLRVYLLHVYMSFFVIVLYLGGCCNILLHGIYEDNVITIDDAI